MSSKLVVNPSCPSSSAQPNHRAHERGVRLIDATAFTAAPTSRKPEPSLHPVRKPASFRIWSSRKNFAANEARRDEAFSQSRTLQVIRTSLNHT